MRRMVVIVTFFALIGSVFAEEQETLFEVSRDSGYIDVPINISFVPGFSIGESIAEGRKIINHVSWNILAGRAARLEGMEFGGIWNWYTEDIVGLQYAGIGNSVGGTAKAIQWGGIANLVRGDFRGVQWAGIANAVGADLEAVQWAGIANVVRGKFGGVQWAGIANVVRGDFEGVQWAGIANLVPSLKAGVQFAGIVNVAQKVESGVQIGVVNVSKENDGIPIGPISYVEEVGIGLDVCADEAKFFNVGLRTGTKRFHNILSIGAQTSDPVRWTIAWAFGGHIDLGESAYLQIDVSTQRILEEDDWWTEEVNALHKLRFLGGWRMTDSMSIYAGPTLNYFVSEFHDGSDLAPWSFWDKEYRNHWERLWPGFAVGVRF